MRFQRFLREFSQAIACPYHSAFSAISARVFPSFSLHIRVFSFLSMFKKTIRVNKNQALAYTIRVIQVIRGTI